MKKTQSQNHRGQRLRERKGRWFTWLRWLVECSEDVNFDLLYLMIYKEVSCV
jgi:hypothetical protein